jgi:hypothetical protein
VLIHQDCAGFALFKINKSNEDQGHEPQDKKEYNPPDSRRAEK